MWSSHKHSLREKLLTLFKIALRVEGRFSEAEEVLISELAMREKVLGKDHIQVAISMSHLAGMCYGIVTFAKIKPEIHNPIIHFFLFCSQYKTWNLFSE